jgi:hypothetical protein
MTLSSIAIHLVAATVILGVDLMMITHSADAVGFTMDAPVILTNASFKMNPCKNVLSGSL